MASIGKVLYHWIKTSVLLRWMNCRMCYVSGPQKDSLRQQLVNCDILTEKMIHNFTISKLFIHGVASQSAT